MGQISVKTYAPKGSDLSGNQQDGFIATRFGHIKGAYLKVLTDGVENVRARSVFEHSPILLLRAELQVYNEHVAELRDKMMAEIMAHMGPWLETFDQMGMSGEIGRAAKARVDDLALDMQLAGIESVTDYADDFMSLDDTWRAANPQQAALEPKD